jgi:diguanylate cyclase (GGDEF)-like protein
MHVPSEHETRLLRLLLIEDSEDDANLILRELTEARYDVLPERVASLAFLTAALERERWDLVIAEYKLPGFHGVTALTLVREYDDDVPFIFVSGTSGEDVAVAAMKAGAHDYIMKTNLRRLVPSVEVELRDAATRRARKQADARLAHLAYHDALTDLPNRLLLDDRLRQGIFSAERSKESLSLLMIDLNEFKVINDTLGHPIGDRMLQEVARRLRLLLRDVDTVARVGGDEFALVLPRTERAGAIRAAEKVLRELRRPVPMTDRVLTISASIGIVSFPEHGKNRDELLQRADVAMYNAKRDGTGYAVYEPGQPTSDHRAGVAL